MRGLALEEQRAIDAAARYLTENECCISAEIIASLLRRSGYTISAEQVAAYQQAQSEAMYREQMRRRGLSVHFFYD